MEGPRVSKLDVLASCSSSVHARLAIAVDLLEVECFEAVPQKKKELQPR